MGVALLVVGDQEFCLVDALAPGWARSYTRTLISNLLQHVVFQRHLHLSRHLAMHFSGLNNVTLEVEGEASDPE